MTFEIHKTFVAEQLSGMSIREIMEIITCLMEHQNYNVQETIEASLLHLQNRMSDADYWEYVDSLI
jgi:hypothetical protein